MRKVIITVIAEAEDDAVLDPVKYFIDVTSKLDCYFDMHVKSVTMREAPHEGWREGSAPRFGAEPEAVYEDVE